MTAGREDTIWLQVNVAVFPASPDRPFIPWVALASAVEEWRAAGRFERFFLVRKPPGLRLRFAGPELGERLEPELASWLVAAQRRNDVRSFCFGCYEPERHRFGGEAGMAIAHDLFDGDTAVALQFEARAVEAEAAPMSRQLLSLATCQDLFVRCLDDTAEVWDVWKGLEQIIRGVAGTWAPPDPAVVEDLRSVLAGTPLAGAADLIAASRRTNQRVASALRTTATAGRLSRGIRTWLTAAGIFHWNRWGLPLELPAVVGHVAAMAALLEPDLPRHSAAVAGLGIRPGVTRQAQHPDSSDGVDERIAGAQQ